MDMMSGMSWMVLLGGVFWLALLAVIVATVVWLIRTMPGRRSDNALDILRERYARGEITREEFEARRRDLSA